MTRNTTASCIQTWVMLWGSRRLHQTNPFLFAISLTEHKTKPKKSRGNTNSIPRVEGLWLWGGWWLERPLPLLHSNDFGETVIALLCSPCGFVSPKQLVVQSQCRLAREEVCMDACIVFSMNLMIVHLYKSQQVYSTSIHLLPWNSGSKTEQNMQENQFLKHRPDVGKGICWSLRAISSFMW